MTVRCEIFYCLLAIVSRPYQLVVGLLNTGVPFDITRKSQLRYCGTSFTSTVLLVDGKGCHRTHLALCWKAVKIICIIINTGTSCVRGPMFKKTFLEQEIGCDHLISAVWGLFFCVQGRRDGEPYHKRILYD